VNFKVLSRNEIKKYQTNEKHIVFSICDPEGQFVKLPKYTTRLGYMLMRFPDFDREIEGYPYNYLIFNKHMAQEIVNFFNMHKDKITLVICQCEAGMSRSAGMAGALAKSIGQDDTYFFKHYLPNMLVYRLILEKALNEGEEIE